MKICSYSHRTTLLMIREKCFLTKTICFLILLNFDEQVFCSLSTTFYFLFPQILSSHWMCSRKVLSLQAVQRWAHRGHYLQNINSVFGTYMDWPLFKQRHYSFMQTVTFVWCAFVFRIGQCACGTWTVTVVRCDVWPRAPATLMLWAPSPAPGITPHSWSFTCF